MDFNDNTDSNEELYKKLFEELEKIKQDQIYKRGNGIPQSKEDFERISEYMLDLLRLVAEKMPVEALQKIVGEIERKEFVRNAYSKLGIPVDHPAYAQRIKEMDEQMLKGDEYRIYLAELMSRSLV